MTEMDLKISDLAEEFEVTCDYIIDEFIIDDKLQPCTMFVVVIDDNPTIIDFN